MIAEYKIVERIQIVGDNILVDTATILEKHIVYWTETLALLVTSKSTGFTWFGFHLDRL